MTTKAVGSIFITEVSTGYIGTIRIGYEKGKEHQNSAPQYFTDFMSENGSRERS